MQAYSFQQELEALRIRINAEAQIPYGRFVKPNYTTIVQVVIRMEGFVTEFYPDYKAKRRKELRLKMLALWTEQKVESTYDLTAYQCSTILDFLKPDGEAGTTDRTQRFLEDSAHAVETGDIL
jgi:hypothetical protein